MSRTEKEINDEMQEFLDYNLTQAKKITTGIEWVEHLKIIGWTSFTLIIKIYKVTLAFKHGLLKNFLSIEPGAVDCEFNLRMFQDAYEMFEKNLKNIPTAKICEEDRCLIPYLMDELTSVLKIMDEMIWITTSKSPFLIKHQNRLLREKADAFLKHPIYEEIIQWTMHPRHFEDGWFADHGFPEMVW